MVKHTKESILRSIDENNIKYIRLQFTDMLGIIKNVEVPASKIEKVLENQQMFDGSSIEGFVRIQEADMYLYPYLIMSAILASGLDGIKNNLYVKPVEINLFQISAEERLKRGIQNLPSNLFEALISFEQGDFIKSVIGPHLTEKLIYAKRAEWDSYKAHVSKWEIDNYLSKY